MKVVLTFPSFFALALALCVAITWHFYSRGAHFLASLLLGSCAGVALASFLLVFVAEVWRARRGAPFCVGDKVEITAGTHRGRAGEVESLCGSGLRVRVALELEKGTAESDLFDWDEIRKPRVK